MAQLELVKVHCVFDVDKKASDSYKNHYGAKSASLKPYHYKALKAMGITVGDKVVVNTPTHGLTVVSVVEVEYLEPDYKFLKWVVARVNENEHADAIKKAERIQVLYQELESMAKNAKQRKKLEDDLANVPEASPLLEELKALEG